MLKTTFAKSFAVAVLGIAAFAFVAAPVKAQTVDINALLAQIAALQSQIAALQGGSTVSTSTMSYSQVGTLRQGSRGPAVVALQQALSRHPAIAAMGIAADGAFGPATTAAVRTFQMDRGLTADGVAGPMTAAALNSYLMSLGQTTTTTTNPGVVTPTMPTGLTGGAGQLEDVDILSSYSNEEILEGASGADGIVMEFEIEADNGSDLMIQNVRLEFLHTGAGSDKLDNYISEVNVWTGGSVVGSADVDDFSESSDTYSRSIQLNNVVVRDGQKARFLVSVDALNNIDSDDLDETWELTLDSIRYVDAQGAVITDSSVGDLGDSVDFTFEDLQSSGDVEFRVSKGDNSPEDQVVEIDDVSDTNDVLLLEIELSAEGTDMTVDEIEFTLEPLGADLDEMVKEFKLLVDGDEIESIQAPATIEDGDTTGVIVFEDLEDDFEIDENRTVTVRLVADIFDTDGNFGNGDSIVASYTSTNRNNTVVEDENGDDVETSDRRGSVIGDVQTFYAEGIAVTFVSSNAVETLNADAAGESDQARYTIVFDVESFGDDFYIDREVAEDEDQGDAGEGLSFLITNPADNTAVGLLSSSTTESEDTADAFFVQEGEKRRFTLTVNVTATTSDFAEVSLEAINFGTEDDDTNAEFFTSNLQDFKTDPLFLTAL
jgi:peptidoglycan hydrolase-like protein with peptidoglycan-binding domain